MCTDHVIQELKPDGTLVSAWDTMAHIPPSETADAWIAAAALQLNVPLVSHNASHYGAVENLT